MVFSSVLITTGGSDPLNVAGKLLAEVYDRNAFADVIFHVIAGRFNFFLPQLEALAEKKPRFIIHKNVDKISELMRSCGAAVSAAGSTLYELCACGTPTVTFTMADNQLDGARGFGESVMAYVGDFRGDESACLDAILAQLHLLRESPKLRAEKSAAMRELVDGNGAGRIAEALI